VPRLLGEVGADAGDISDHVDPERGQLIRRSDPRTHQDRRAAVHAGAENNVPGMQQLARHEHHANRSSFFDHHVIDLRLAADLEVRALAHPLEIRNRAVLTDAVDDVARDHANADVIRAVHILDSPKAAFGRRADERAVQQGQTIRVPADRHRTPPTVVAHVALGVVLEAAEVVEQLLEGPPRVAQP
jgi:hypothetical protein